MITIGTGISFFFSSSFGLFVSFRLILLLWSIPGRQGMDFFSFSGALTSVLFSTT